MKFDMMFAKARSWRKTDLFPVPIDFRVSPGS